MNVNKRVHKLETVLAHIELIEDFLRSKAQNRDWEFTPTQQTAVRNLLEDIEHITASYLTIPAHDLDHSKAA